MIRRFAPLFAALLALCPLRAAERPLATAPDPTARDDTRRDAALRKNGAETPWGPAGRPERGHAAGAEYAIPMLWNNATFENFRNAYLSEGGRQWLTAIMERAAPFMPYIQERIRFYRLPEELAFLPLIESEFSAQAVSRSGAMGLWQFMRNSIAGYNMRIDDWMDERRDFMKSTDAALRKLASNYEYLGDWHLALAAYNAGLGAISRAVTKLQTTGLPEPGFLDLLDKGLLKKETAAYVPKFLAAASILRYPGRHGLEPRWKPPAAWEAISPGRPVDLGILAEKSGIGLDLLRKANAELRYSVTPPSPDYLLKIPEDKAAAVREILADPAASLVKFHLHHVRSGDSLSAISRRYGTPLGVIVKANPGLNPDVIKLGQLIVVPVLKDGPVAARPEDPQPPAFTGSYTVAKGDTLWSIALRYNVQPEILAERNGLTLSSLIREGKTLKVPILE